MSKHSKTITVIGAGYVGLPTATLFALAGHKVYILDVNKTRLAAIKEGRSFFYEEGLDPLVKKAITEGNLLPTTSYKESISDSDVVFSCVGTPDNPDGSSNLTYVFEAARSTAKHANTNTIYVQKSTVPVGTGQKIIDEFQALGKKIDYVSNPEFLREGTALSDSLYFDRIVVGSDNKKVTDTVCDLYKDIEHIRNDIAKLADIAKLEKNGAYIRTSLVSAELTKVTANAFLALKISFTNSIAKLADHTGADINEVMDAVGADNRIGRAFLNAGRGYGGGCFPKDVSGLISSANEHGVDLAIMTAASDVNESMPGYIVNKAQEHLGESLDVKKVAVLGLAFKAGTSDARKSPGVNIANILDKNGAHVTVYDPQASHEAKDDLRKNIKISDDIYTATQGACAVFIATDWPEFKTIIADRLELTTPKLFVDAVNIFEANTINNIGLKYIGVGK